MITIIERIQAKITFLVKKQEFDNENKYKMVGEGKKTKKEHNYNNKKYTNFMDSYFHFSEKKYVLMEMFFDMQISVLFEDIHVFISKKLKCIS